VHIFKAGKVFITGYISYQSNYMYVMCVKWLTVVTHTHTHTCTHTCTHTYHTRTHAHTHTQSSPGSTEESISLISDSIPRVFTHASEALERCMLLTEGWGVCGVIKAIEVIVDKSAQELDDKASLKT